MVYRERGHGEGAEGGGLMMGFSLLLRIVKVLNVACKFFFVGVAGMLAGACEWWTAVYDGTWTLFSKRTRLNHARAKL